MDLVNYLWTPLDAQLCSSWHLGIFVIGPILVPYVPSLSFFCGILSFILPWYLENKIWRFSYGMASFTHCVRLLQLYTVKDTKFNHWWYRVFFVQHFHDLRTSHHITSKWNTAKNLLLQIFMAFPVHLACYFYFIYCGKLMKLYPELNVYNLDSYLFHLSRCVCGGFYFCSTLYIVDACYRMILVPFNMDVKPMMNNPHLAPNFTDFWAINWNMVIGKMMSHMIYKPVLHLTGNKNLSVIATFFTSGLYHCYPILLLIDLKSYENMIYIIIMMSFFLIQVPLIFLEKKFHIRGHFYFYTIMLILLPLFIQPLLIFFDHNKTFD